jgi:hypothetical protein
MTKYVKINLLRNVVDFLSETTGVGYPFSAKLRQKVLCLTSLIKSCFTLHEYEIRSSKFQTMIE